VQVLEAELLLQLRPHLLLIEVPQPRARRGLDGLGRLGLGLGLLLFLGSPAFLLLALFFLLRLLVLLGLFLLLLLSSAIVVPAAWPWAPCITELSEWAGPI
jgi:hypothetical protein